MASFKVRRQGLFTGGVNVVSGTSSSFMGSASFGGSGSFTGTNTFSGTTIFTGPTTIGGSTTTSGSTTYTACALFAGQTNFTGSTLFSASANTFNNALTSSGSTLFSGSTSFTASVNTFSGAVTHSSSTLFSGSTSFTASANFNDKVKLGTAASVMTGILWGKAAVLIPDAAAGSTSDTTASVRGVPTTATVVVSPYTSTGSFLHVRTSVSDLGILVSIWANNTASPIVTACAIAASYMWIAVW